MYDTNVAQHAATGKQPLSDITSGRPRRC